MISPGTPVEITELQRDDLTGSQAQANKHRQDSEVALADDGAAVTSPLTPYANGATGDQCFTDWLARNGPYTTNGVAMSVIKKSRQGLPAPDASPSA